MTTRNVNVPQRIYLHAPGDSVYQGNGGLVVMRGLYLLLRDLGMPAAFVDHKDRLRPEMLQWLDLPFTPEIRPWSEAIKGRLVSSWINVALNDLQKRYGKFLTEWAFAHLYYWDQGEILRNRYAEARQLVLASQEWVVVANPDLVPYYQQAGVSQTVGLPLWIDDMFNNRQTQIPGSIGHQRDTDTLAWEALTQRHGADRLLFCHGAYRNVAVLMGHSECYLWWNNPKDALQPILRGEEFGLSLYEALASGAAVVARANDTTLLRLSDIIPLPYTLDEALQALDELRNDPLAREAQVERSTEYIRTHYRLNQNRRDLVEEWLCR